MGIREVNQQSTNLIKTPVTIQDGVPCNISYQLKSVNYCCEALHLRCLRESWLLLCDRSKILGIFYETNPNSINSFIMEVLVIWKPVH